MSTKVYDSTSGRKMNSPIKEEILNPNRVQLKPDVSSWSCHDVTQWLESIGQTEYEDNFKLQRIDGIALLLLTEADLKNDLNVRYLGDVKRIYAAISQLHQDVFEETSALSGHSIHDCLFDQSFRCKLPLKPKQQTGHRQTPGSNDSKRSRTYSSDSQAESANLNVAGGSKSRGVASNLRPEYLKTLVSCIYMFLVTWVTAIVMVFVHDRVPDKERHPPLPDIFLDNVPHISWAFELCEITILILSITMLFILYFHKHRSIMMRRFSALSGSVFLLRCATMFITSLSVPGHHLECSPRDQTDIWTKLHMASIIWRGGGLSIKGVRTCGDYMFSGHTTALTLLNFFITEYTPRRMYFLHITSWVLNTFGIFFILAAHEHYSIDVFIAFYITSRMFLYYHSLANNRALHQRDSFRTKIWFPMFSYFEAHIDGIVPNEYTNPLCKRNFVWFIKKIIVLSSKLKTILAELTNHTSPIHAAKKNF